MLDYSKIWRPKFSDRTIPILGDLSQSFLFNLGRLFMVAIIVVMLSLTGFANPGLAI